MAGLQKLRGALRAAFGQVAVSYTPPAWTKRAPGAAGSKPRQPKPKAPRRRKLLFFVPLFSVLVIVAAAALVLLLRPEERTQFAVSPPAAKRLVENAAIPSLALTFNDSAARIELAGKEITSGISISPALPGKWVWADDRKITFFPSADWQVGAEYSVKMEKTLFGDKVKLAGYSFSFRTAELQASLEDAQLYIDPLLPQSKRITATVVFTHPVETAGVQKALKLDFPFTVTYDQYLAKAYIVSENIPLSDKTVRTKVKVAGRIAPAGGGSPLAADLSAEIVIPGRLDYASIQGLDTALVREESYAYQRLLAFQFNPGVRPQELAEALSVFLLPQDLPELPGTKAEKDHEWREEEIDAHLLGLSSRLPLEPQPVENEFGAEVSVSYRAPSGRYLFLRLDRRLETFGGYLIPAGFRAVLRVPAIPKEARIMHEGALLSLAGERKISLFANDLEHVQFEIGRIIPDQVNHLVTQSWGDLNDLSFQQNWMFDLENIASLYTSTLQLRKEEPGVVQYFSFDFDRYLRQETDPRLKYGLFYFKVREWDPVKKEAGEILDARLILVTDLGLLVKKSAYAGYDVFVQSIHSGAPVADALVEVIGKNGLPVASAYSAADGHLALPELSSFTREKAPAVFIVRRGGDMSFLPLEREGRFLNYSRFDTGGARGTADPGFIDAYLFSDRGLFRPGERMNFGVIVKAGDWSRDLEGLPLELSMEDPRGLEIQKQRLSLSRSGFEQYSFATAETSPTGRYELKLFIARDQEERKLLGSAAVRVEEFQPDRLSIRSYLSGEKELAWISPQNLKATVSLMNLFGTPASGNPVQASLTLSPAMLYLPKHPDYYFFDPLQTDKSFEDPLPEGRTGEDGNVEFPIDLSRFAQGTFRLNFTAKGLEKQGGRAVQTESTAVVSPLASVVGYKPDGRLDFIYRDAARIVHFLAVGPDQRPVALSGLSLSIAELRFVSVLEKSPDGLYRYKSVEKKVPAGARALSLPKEGYALSLPTGEAGDFEAVVQDAGGRKLASLRYTVVGSGNLSRSLDRSAELQIKLDKSDYAAGEAIQVSIKAPYTGAGLITIERDRVHAYKWFSTSATATVQSIQIPPGIEGSAYVNVSFIRASDSREIYTSPLSYGVVPFSINKSQRSNPLLLKAEQELLSGRPLRVSYSSAKPGRIVVFAVDEGILQVARYSTPRPLEHFFKKRALEVVSSQILDLILPEFSMVQAVSAMGGDEGEALRRNLNPFRRKNKPPVAFWSGLLPTDGEERTVEFKIPDYFNGSLRIMAVAVSPDSIGVQDRQALVRSHFVLTPNVPPVVTPQDEVEIGVNVLNDLKGQAGETEVRLQMKPTEQFELLSDGEVTLKIGQKKEKTAFFSVRVKNSLGTGELAFSASGAGLSSKLQESVSIRPAVPYRAQVDSGATRAAESEIPVDRRMHQAFRSLEAAATFLPSGMSFGLKKYLDAYPYGCTEQIVSRAFAVLALHRLSDFGISKLEAQESFNQAHRVLRFRQNQDGEFGLWAANSDVLSFISVYAMHYLTEARAAGWPVERGMFDGGLSALKLIAGRDPGDDGFAQLTTAYAIYVLTANGVVTTSYLNTLRDSKKLAQRWRDGPIAAFLGAAYALLKQKGEARSLLSGAFTAGWNLGLENDYCIGLTQAALCLYLASRHLPELAGPLAERAVEGIAEAVTQARYNTISSSYAILALVAYSSLAAPEAGERLLLSGKAKDGSYAELKLAGEAVLRAQVPYGTAALKLTNRTGRRIFYQLLQAGFDLDLPTEAVNKGIEVFREYLDSSGRPLNEAAVGSEIKVRLRIRSLAEDRPRIGNVAIVDLLPSGCELVYDRATGQPVGSGSLPVDFAEPREDRLLLFCTAEKELRDFVYTIRPTSKGRLFIPPAYAESMYDRSLWSQHPAGGVLLVKE